MATVPLQKPKLGITHLLEHIKYYSKHLTTWMKPSKRHVSIIHQRLKAWVQYQPLGVIGIITPWNYPLLLDWTLDLCFGCRQPCHDQNFQFIGTLWSNLKKKRSLKPFPQELVSVTNGGGAIRMPFCRLAFDKLILQVQPMSAKPSWLLLVAENLFH